MRTLTLDYVVGALKTLLTHLCFKGFRCKWRRVWSVVSDGCSKLTSFDNWTCKRFNLPVPRAAYVVEIGDIYRNPWCATKSISQYIHWTPWLWTFSNPFAILSWLISSLLSNYEAKKNVNGLWLAAHSSPYIWCHSMICQLGLRIFDCFMLN